MVKQYWLSSSIFSAVILLLSLVSRNVPDYEKQLIAQAMLKSTPEEPLGPAPLKPVVKIDHETRLHTLAKSPRSHLVFQLLKLDASFLSKNPIEWEEDQSFQRLRRFSKNFHVTNVVAEHCIQVVSDFTGVITKDETQRQCLIKTVYKERRERSDLRRKALQPNVEKENISPSENRAHLRRANHVNNENAWINLLFSRVWKMIAF